MIKLIQIMNAYFTEVQKLGTFPEMQYPNTSLYHITSCDGGWTPFPAHKYPGHTNAGRCYRHHTLRTNYHKIEKRSTHHNPSNGQWTWTDARAYCRAFQKADSDLASIQDWRTNDFVTRLAPGTMFWIGAHWVSGSWQWTDGSQWHYTNWAPGHPTIGTTAYVAIGQNGVWRDYNNNGPMFQGVPGIMCQYTGGEVTRGT